jgi:membrane protein DedA with SNARE-associated domain
MGQKRRFAKEANVLSNLTTTLTLLIQNFYVSTGLLGIALAMAIESCCIPLPSEIVMPLAGIMVAGGSILKGTNPLLALLLVGVAGAIGSVLGSLAAYAIGASGGRPLMLKYGRYVLISQHDADKADAFFQRWGNATAFFSRLLPVVRTYISLPAGISKMPLATFSLYTFLGSLIWSILLAYVGTIVHANLDALSPIFHTFDAVIVVVLVALIVLYVWRHVRNDRKAREAHAAEALASQAPAQPAQPGQVAQNWAQPMPQMQAQGQFRNPQSLQGWAQQSAQPGWNQQQPQQNWGQQPAQQAWNAQQPPQAPQQGWSQQPAQQTWNQQQPAQQGWGQQPQQPAQQGWGAPQNPQAPQTPQNWGQQPPTPQPWPPQTGR